MSPSRITFGDRIGPALSVDTDEATELLREIGDNAEDVRPAMRLIKSLIEEGHAKQYSTKGGFLGTPWPEVSAETQARKARSGIPSLASTMVESGALEESLTGGKGGRSRVSKGSVSVGTSLFYALFHLKPKRKGMPARPVVGINEGQRLAALKIIERHILGRA